MSQETTVLDDLETAWNLICNVSGGNWEMQSQEWRDAVVLLREKYLSRIKESGKHKTELEIKIGADAPAGRQGILYFPNGKTKFNGEDVANEELADKLLAIIKSGESISLPSDVNEHGKRTWEFIPLS